MNFLRFLKWLWGFPRWILDKMNQNYFEDVYGVFDYEEYKTLGWERYESMLRYLKDNSHL